MVALAPEHVMPGRPRSVAITGMGAVSSLGVGCDALWAALAGGGDAIRPVERFSTEPFATHLAATVPGWSVPADRPGRAAIEFALAAAREAWDAACLGDAFSPGRIAVVLGTSVGTHHEAFHEVTEAVGDHLGAAGPRLTISVACTSSTNAIGLGRDLLAAGTADVVLAGGSDVLTDELFAGFHALGVLSPAPCAPFSEPSGTTLGEGAGFLVLEREETARSRGAAPLAFVLGYGLSADAFHATAPDPSGAGVARALRQALQDAGVAAAEVGYVNAHGTGTESNDAAEWRGICAALGPGADSVPVSSSKSFLGHAQGAAGVLEAICTLLARQHGLVPPTHHFTGPRPHCPADPVSGPRPLPRAWRYAVCTNSAFGGANAAVVLGNAAAPRGHDSCRREVFLRGEAGIGPHGIDQEALAHALAGGEQSAGRVPPFRLDALLRGVDIRGLDPAARFLSGATALALARAGGAPRGAARDRAGLVLGTASLSPSAVREYRDSIEARGLERLSASAFTRMVLNAPAGACSRLHALRGPTSTLAAERGGGLLAVVYAAELMGWDAAADLMLAAGVDELPHDARADGSSEGAGCVVLSVEGRSGAPRLAGWSFAGPGDVAGAAAAALRMASVSGAEVDSVHGAFDPAALLPSLGQVLPVRDPGRAVGRTAAAGASFAVIAAARQVREGRSRVALVADPGGRSAACAVVITAGAGDG